MTCPYPHPDLDLSDASDEEIIEALVETRDRLGELHECVVRLLKHNRGALHPAKGSVDAKLIREVCNIVGLDEDDFLDRIYLRDKKSWGLE